MRLAPDRVMIMESPQPQQISISGRLVIEGQLPPPHTASPENANAPEPPPWWQFWTGPAETVSARASVIASGATTVLAASTLGLAIVTYCQFREFEHEARLRLRSYLSIGATRTPLEVGNPITLAVQVQATGQTPALDVRAHGHAEVAPFPWPKGQPMIINETSGTGNTVSLSPGGIPMSLPSEDHISQSDYDLIKTQKTHRYYIWGKITYKDVFGCHRWQNFCFNVNDINGSDPADIVSCAEHNESEGDPGACPAN